YEMFLNALSHAKFSEVDSIIAMTPSRVDIVFIGPRFYICTAKLDVFDKHFELKDTIYFRK
ncbi:MAG TPA: hypothetical protein VFU29_02510, partial [Chitinophagaceae bacterium]|nr:hypothetical protein [Chitinophagaceae bacterium]